MFRRVQRGAFAVTKKRSQSGALSWRAAACLLILGLAAVLRADPPADPVPLRGVLISEVETDRLAEDHRWLARCAGRAVTMKLHAVPGLAVLTTSDISPDARPDRDIERRRDATPRLIHSARELHADWAIDLRCSAGGSSILCQAAVFRVADGVLIRQTVRPLRDETLPEASGELALTCAETIADDARRLEERTGAATAVALTDDAREHLARWAVAPAEAMKVLDSALREPNPAKRIEACTQALRIAPDYAMARRTLGEAYFHARKPTLGYQQLTQTIEDEPANPLWYVERARLYGTRGALDRAVEDCDRAIARRPDFLSAWIVRAVANERIEEWQSAADDWTRCIALWPHRIDWHARRAFTYGELGAWDRAAEDYDVVIAKEPRNGRALLRRAQARMRAGAVEAALDDLDAAEALTPDNPAVYIHRARALLLLRRPAEARAALRRLDAFDVEPPEDILETLAAEEQGGEDRAAE